LRRRVGEHHRGRNVLEQHLEAAALGMGDFDRLAELDLPHR
jgi:hypothetical protein